MIDMFSLALSHGLLLIIAWRLVFRPDLDDDDAEGTRQKTDFLDRPVTEDARENTTNA